MTIYIANLYNDLMNLYGENGNVKALKYAFNSPKQFGLDKEKAYLCGLIHDCAKCFSTEKLLAIIEALYNSKGIYSNTSIEELEKLRTTDYPIFSDLKRFIPEYKKKENSPEKIRIINQLEILISRFLTGTDAYLFDGYTTIDLSNDLIAFNMKELLYSGNERLINTHEIETNYEDNISTLLASDSIVDKDNFKCYDADAKYYRRRNDVINNCFCFYY